MVEGADVNAVRIRHAVLDDILAHARAASPNECCGLLIGTADLIETSERARNLRAWRFPAALRLRSWMSPIVGVPRLRYLIDPVDHFAAIRRARASKRDVVGAYHSHPWSPPVPSRTDLAEAVYRNFLYLIVSPSPDGPLSEVRGYRLGDGNFEAVRLVPTA